MDHRLRLARAGTVGGRDPRDSELVANLRILPHLRLSHRGQPDEDRGRAACWWTVPYGRASGGSVFNGSVWSLTYELACYAVVGACGALGLLTRRPAVVLALTGAFLMGCTIRLYWHRIRVHGGIAVASAAVVGLSVLQGGFIVVGILAYAYLLFYVAVALPRWWRSMGVSGTIRTAYSCTPSRCSSSWRSSVSPGSASSPTSPSRSR